jgi:site-specific DNA-methyltransferase (adenine-specific)
MRVETVGNATLYLGDCREVLPSLPDCDAIVTDPPYELGHGWHGDFSGKNGKAVMWGSQPNWDKLCPEGLNTALTKAPNAIVWGGHLYELPARSAWLAWDKVQKFSSGDFELAWTSRNGATRTFRMSRIDAYQNVGDGKQHPTQKPVKLMEWCLSFFPDAKTVLDPFMGVGTTGVACANTGRVFVGIEKEQRYFDIACERIDAAQKQRRLFA